MTDFFAATAERNDPLRTDLISMILERDAATPRHRQRELGPSEVGHPCMKKMALGMSEIQKCNPPYDPLPSIIGVSVHKWLESAARHANSVLNRHRWSTEIRVNVAPGLAGSCDLYDHDTATVIDWKCPGNDRFDKYVKDPGPLYKNQVYLYGRGFENAGLPVKRVAIAFLPRGRTLHNLHVWRADYDRTIADNILKRRDAVIAMMSDFDVDHYPERFEWFPIEPYDCVWCPWFRPQPRTAVECRGDQ